MTTVTSPRRQILLAALVAAFLVTPSCESVRKMIDETPKPSLDVVGVSFKDFDMQSLTLNFDVEVTNPYSVALPILGLDYALSSGGSSFLSGDSKEQTTIPANEKRVVPVLARVDFLETLRVLSGVKPGNIIPVKADLGVSVDAPVYGNLRLPIEAEKDVPIPAIPDVSLESVDWKKLSWDSASAELVLALGNGNDFPLDLSELGFNLALSDVEIGRTGVDKAVKLSPGDKKTVRIGLDVTPIKLGLAAFNMLKGAQASYRIDGGVKAGTPFGPLSMPLKKSGSTKLTH